MSSGSRQGGLGRGLAALIPQDVGTGTGLRELPLTAIAPNPRQPRGTFDDDELRGLAASIHDVGLLQPIVVRRTGPERYELVAGERRMRASRLAGRTTIPAIVRETGDDELLKEALVENIHRVQLNPLEEAAAYRSLLDDLDVTQEELAGRLGKSRPTIANTLRLLALPPSVQRKVASGVLSAGHAKAILALDDAAARSDLADRVVAEGLSVRATEEIVRLRVVEEPSGTTSRPPRRRAGGDTPAAPEVRRLEEQLSAALDADVKITVGARSGTLRVRFSTVDDLDRIVEIVATGISGR